MRYLALFARVVGLGMVGIVMAQTPAPAPPAGGTPGTANPGSPGASPGSRPPAQPFPTDPRQQQQQRFPEMQRPIFLSGKVLLDDGTPPPEQVVIERVCNGTPRPEAYTDSKGRFQFQLGQNQGMMADASVSGNDPLFDNSPGVGGMNPRSMGGAGNRGVSEQQLMGCEIRASLPGYRSEAIPLSGRRFMDNPDIGTIILRRLGNVEGLTFSASSALAPKDAKKAYEKGRELAKKNKMADAQKEFEKAVTIYPKFANAWTDLGMAHEAQNRPEDARKAYTEALNIDSKLVKPYVNMAWLWARENKWQECWDASTRALKLNPFDFPQAYFVNAVAALNLNKLDDAEKSAREGIKLDPNNRMPKFRHVLGVVLAQKQDYKGAMENVQSFLKMVPADSPDAVQAKKLLAEVERVAQNQKPEN